MPKLHDVPFLMNQIHSLIKEDTGKDIPEDLLDYADNLSKYGIIPRYPNKLDVDEPMTKERNTDGFSIVNVHQRTGIVPTIMPEASKILTILNQVLQEDEGVHESQAEEAGVMEVWPH